MFRDTNEPRRRRCGWSAARRTALKLPLAATAAAALIEAPRAGAEPGRWPAERANRWYRAHGWLVGSNYIAANAPVQPLTSGVWHGEWRDPQRRSAIAGIQLDNSDVVTFHSYAKPADFEERIAELAPLGRPVLCTEYLARGLGSTIEDILPIAKRHNVGAYSWGLVAGKTQTYLPWDSWDRPYPAPPKVWFHDLFHADGRPYRDREIQTVRELTGRELLR